MTSAEQHLWQSIKAFKIDDPDASFSFTDRLARENHWDLNYTIRVVLEYKKFIFLICTTKNPLTPSEEVDQAWHLHLIYTQSYWIEFCEKILKRKIHHGPTKGGGEEKNKYEVWYEKTKNIYLKKFGYSPPQDIWPSSEKRFSANDFVRINKKNYWIIKKLHFLIK